MMLVLLFALSTARATEKGFGEAEWTSFDHELLGKTDHNDHLPKEVALSKFLKMSGSFFAAKAETNDLDEAKLKIVDELFDAYDADNDHMWSEAEFSDYYVEATRMEMTWEKISGNNEEVDRVAMEAYFRGVFSGEAGSKISSLLAVSQGIALTAPTLDAYINEITDSYDYPLAWEAFKKSHVRGIWLNIPGPKYDGLASEDSMTDFFFGPTKDIVQRMETMEISAAASEFDTVGDFIEGVSGTGERRRKSQEEAAADAVMCALGAAGDVFWGPFSMAMSTIGCIDIAMNARGECGYDDLLIPGNGALSCMAGFVPFVGLANNMSCAISNAAAIYSIATGEPPQCKWFGRSPACGRHQCHGFYSMLGPQKFDACGDGNRCISGTKTQCCEPYRRDGGTPAPVQPAMVLWDKNGGGYMPVCRSTCKIRSGYCYKCSNGRSCMDCKKRLGGGFIGLSALFLPSHAGPVHVDFEACLCRENSQRPQALKDRMRS